MIILNEKEKNIEKLNIILKEMEKKIGLNEEEKNNLIRDICKNLNEKYKILMKDSLDKFKKTIDLMLEEKEKGIIEKFQNKILQLDQFN